MTEPLDEASRHLGVQSIERAFALIEALERCGGEAGLTTLANQTGLAVGSAHRILQTLVQVGYLRQAASKQYALGPSLARLGLRAHDLLGASAYRYLDEAVRRTGESANLAMLDQHFVVYVAQVESPHHMRMFTQVGRRVLPHCTGVGKALLSQLEDDQVVAILERTGMPAQTIHTVTTIPQFMAQLDEIRASGYALDDGEQEIGVRCVAVPLIGAPTPLAMSVSGPAERLPMAIVERVYMSLADSASPLVRALNATGRQGD